MAKTHHKWPRDTDIKQGSKRYLHPSKAGTEKRLKSPFLLEAGTPGQDCLDLEPRNVAALCK